MDSATDDVLVSVVMIFRDATEFFDEAIESVLAQTQPSVELLLCDDGSADASTAIARRWADRRPGTVRYLEHDGHAHRGMSSTRNLGVSAARGQYVAFLDADDVWEPGHLRHEVALLDAHPEVGLVCGQAVDWYSWADPEAADVPGPLPWPPGVVVAPPHMLAALLRRGDFRTPTCSLTVRRHALDAVGGSADEFQGMYEDQALLAKLFLTHRCIISGSRSARYRKHGDSATALAVRSETYDPLLPNVSRQVFLRWLTTRPAIRDEPDCAQIRSLLDGALRPYAAPQPSLGRRVRSLAGAAVPAEARRIMRGGVRRVRAIGPVRMGTLRRVVPLSRQFGYDRGLPVDRYFVERFLAANAHVITGRVLEVGDREYTNRFGGTAVTQADVLNIDAGHPDTTIVADLAYGEQIQSGAFDCLIITQTLHLIFDLSAAVRTLHRILGPGGTLLATFPGISPVSTDRWADTWYWSLTPHSAARLFATAFGADNVEVSAYGNVLTCVAFLEGMAVSELHPEDLDVVDPQFPMLVTVRAYRPAEDEPEGVPHTPTAADQISLSDPETT